MIVLLKIEHGKDATGEQKRVLWSTIKSEVEGIGTFTAVSELPEDSPLAQEVNIIVTEMLAQKQNQMRETRDKQIAKKRSLSKTKKKK